MSPQKTIAVIGAGMAGLCAAKHSIQQGFDVTVFEQGTQVGGTWIYTDKVGLDENGLDVHSSMYKGLRTNIPKEIMGFPDYSVPDSGNGKSYLTSEKFLEFLQAYAKKFNVTERVKFQHYVVRICPVLPNNKKWEIIVKNLNTGNFETFFFDFVFICNGHHTVPYYPVYPGLENYKGTYQHSRTYKDANDYKDKSVLVVGGWLSALDIIVQLKNVARKVTISHHLKDEDKKIIPKSIYQMCDIKNFIDNDVIFCDGRSERFDVIIFCTGFRYVFPFISSDCGMHVEDLYHVRPLYKHLININNPTMCIVGLPHMVCLSDMIDLQIRFVLKFYSGEKTLPSKDEMLKDTENEMEERWKRGYRKKYAHVMGTVYQEKYYADLAKIAQVESMSAVKPKIWNDSMQWLKNDLENYREFNYKILDTENFVRTPVSNN